MRTVFICPKCGREMKVGLPHTDHLNRICGEATCECGNVIKGCYGPGLSVNGAAGAIIDGETREILLMGKDVPDESDDIETLRNDFSRVNEQRIAALNDLAQMKSTLSDTQQKLRAVQEDRDEFAAKMNDAVERADQLQARCGDLEKDVARLNARNRELLDERLKLNGQIDAFSFVIEHWRGGGT